MDNNEHSAFDNFWFSLRNLQRMVYNIMLLFGAVNDDFDEIDAAMSDMDTRLDSLEGQTLDPSVNTIFVYDDILDGSNNGITDSTGIQIEARAIYDRR